MNIASTSSAGCRILRVWRFPVVRTLHSALPLAAARGGDAPLEKLKDERKKISLERRIKEHVKLARRLKPVDDVDFNVHIGYEIQERTREKPQIPEEVAERRALLEKDWNRYMNKQKKQVFRKVSGVARSQKDALRQLRKESPDLYEAAIAIDGKFLPFECEGPAATPPIKGYVSPDGDYIDNTRTFEK